MILAPFGLNGILTGVTYRDSDAATRKHVEEWKKFYPVKLEEGRDNDHNKLPNLVEVIVGKSWCVIWVIESPTVYNSLVKVFCRDFNQKD